ncbi:hypothetical protein JCM8115_003814 [Rhodotorula mucilaginosa]
MQVVRDDDGISTRDATLTDGIVETTSEVAVRNFVERVVQSTAALNPVDLVQTRVDDKGRTIYRLSTAALSHIGSKLEGRPPAASTHLLAPRTSPLPRTPLGDVSNLPSDKSLRASRSIPLLRSGPPAATLISAPLAPNAEPQRKQRQLRRADSSTMLRNQTDPAKPGAEAVAAPSRSGSAKKASGNGQGDVFGRILGWREGVADRSSELSSAGAEGRKLAKRVSGSGVASHPGASLADLAKGELPPDLVACLDAIEQAENGRERPLAAPQDRPSYAREPFGSGVRVHQRLQPHDTVGSWTSPPGTAEVVEQSTRRLMREVSSNDSVRTARLEDLFPEPLLSASAPSTGRPRFCDPSVFDAFHRHNTRASAPSHVEETAPPDAASPHGIPFGHHGRLDSSTSIASNRSGASSHVSAHEITVVPAVDDDPRFVIWGMKGAKASSEVPLRSTDAPPRRASPASSATDSPKRSHDRRRSSVRSDERSWPASSLRNSTNSTTARNTRERVLMAATAERLVAELTSNISPDLLAAFFITYRNFMEPIDLLHRLLARFEWAMPPPEHWPTTATGLTASTSSLSSLSAAAAEDEALRRIVRVRTFVVLRYWLLNHFMRDYYPSHELRTTLTTWLNSSARDSRFRASPKDVRLIKALKKTVRKCKDAFILGKSRESMLPPQRSPVLVAGEEEGEDEVDLDDAVRADRDAVIAAGKTAADSHSRGLSTPLAPSIYSRDEESYPLPDDDESRPRGPVARRLSSAVGTFGRIKRKLRDGARKYAAPATSDTLPFGATSAELSRDLLRDESRLSRYLQQLGIELLPSETSAVSTPAISTTCSGVKLLAPEMDVPVSRLDDPPLAGSGRTEQELDTPVPDLTASIGRGINTPPLPVTSGTPDADGPFRGLFANDAVIPLAPIFTLAPGAFGPLTTFGRPESVRIELDDLEDSSDDDEDVIEAKRALKRQPPAPMFAHTRPWHSSDESSQDHGLLGSQTRKTHGLSELFVDDEAGFEKSELVTVIPNFVLDGLVDSDDEDEPGDVEAALRRLEGLVDESKERKHALRVQQQMEKSRKLEEDARARQQALEQAAGLSAQASRGPSDTPSALVDSPMEAINVGLLPSLQGLQSAAGSTQSVATSPAWMGSVANIRASPEGTVRRATPPTVTPAPPTHKPNLTARLFGAPSVEKKAPTTASVSAVSPPGHRAFVLYFRTDVLARQFALIERDLLRLVRYQELADGSWRHYIGETDVLDWDGHVKDRRRADVAALESGQRASSAVQDVIARFNLTANWVTSEVLLTASSDERVVVLAKFIRLAFKCYCQHNLQTMMQVVHGLAHPDVERLGKTWARVPSWEMRKLNGMKKFCSHLRNFKHVRSLMSTLVADHDLGSRAQPLTGPGNAVQGCVPFLGIFLHDLAQNADLPTFLDPSNPASPADITSNGTLVSLQNPSAFLDLPPLPPSVPLAPLVNVHKFRQLAEIVQRVATFQELASQYRHEPVPGVYKHCLKLRALDARILHDLSLRLEP